MSRILAIYSNRGEALKKLAPKLLNKIRHKGCNMSKIYLTRGTVMGQNYFPPEKEVDFDNNNIIVVANGYINTNQTNNKPLQKIISDLYVDEGENLINYLEGSFAFVLGDGQKIFAARDPLGLKPLYYTDFNDTIIFASEIKALIGQGFEIKTFPPGHYFTSDKGFVKYYELKNNKDNCSSPEEAASEIRKRLIEVIEKYYDRDKNVGIYLSGGIDSSIIAAAAREVISDLETFSVGVKDSTDLPNARIVADHVGANHHECIYDLDEMLEVLPEVLYHLESFDMYLVRSAVANYLLSRMAHKFGKNLVLCGEGSDELFAGYSYLKKFDTSEIERELYKLTFTSHANGFQRVDRMTSAFSIDAIVPFVDISLVEFALNLPVEWKMYKKDSSKIEKWILRKAFENDLPPEIVWREKKKFSEGAGSSETIQKYAEKIISDQEFEREKLIKNGFMLRSKEELFYYRIFRELFPNDSVIDTIGRTATVG